MPIHPTAVIDPRAELGRDVHVGPFAVVAAGAILHDGVRIDAHGVVAGPCELGAGSRVHAFACVAGDAQDRKYRGEPSRVVAGRGCVFREGVTVHRGTAAGDGVTRIGDDVLLMAQAHVAHDCRVGNDVVLANGAALAGHVWVGDGVVFGGLAGVHQFCRIGRLAMVGAGAMVAQDVPPFMLVHGDRARLVGLNRVGLRRAGMSPATIGALHAAFGELFLHGRAVRAAASALHASSVDVAEVAELAAFCATPGRGVCRARGEA
jgi:UDP-N-acetylglucosamine acyltransferase